MKRTILCVLVLSLLLSLFAGCGQSSTKNGKSTITDMIGNEIVIEKTPEKIIALQASDVEILYALGVQDNIIAVGEYANYPEDANNKKKLGTAMNTSIEEIIDLEPDVIFMGKMAQTVEQAEQLQQAGITVVITDAQTIEDAYRVIGVIGQVVGKADKAEQIVNDMKAGFEDLRAKSEQKEKLNAYIEVSPLQYGLWTCGKGTFVHEIMEILGMKNVFEELNGWGEISEEQVIDKNPDIILTNVGAFDDAHGPVEEILARENWSGINAVVNNKVYMIDADKTSRPGPRLLEAAEEIYEMVYGE